MIFSSLAPSSISLISFLIGFPVPSMIAKETDIPEFFLGGLYAETFIKVSPKSNRSG